MQVGVPLYPLIVLPAAAAIGLFWVRARGHLAVLRAGRPIDRFDRPLQRVWGIVVYVIAQRRLLNDLGPGLMHAAIFWGFLVLLVTTGNYMTNGLIETILRWPLGGIAWLLAVAVANLFIGLILAALAYAAWRRIAQRPTRLALSRDAFIILALILGVVVTELAGDTLRFVARPDDPARRVAMLAGPLSLLAAPLGAAAAAAGFGILAWMHIGFVMVFGTYLPYSKHLHILTSEPNVYFRELDPRGALRKMDLEAEAAPGEEIVFGARGLKDLTWRHLLDGLSCTECGRCMEFCPASMTGKTLSPKHFMEGLRDQIVAAETALAAAAGAQRAARGGASGGIEASDTALAAARQHPREQVLRHPHQARVGAAGRVR